MVQFDLPKVVIRDLAGTRWDSNPDRSNPRLVTTRPRTHSNNESSWCLKNWQHLPWTTVNIVSLKHFTATVRWYQSMQVAFVKIVVRWLCSSDELKLIPLKCWLNESSIPIRVSETWSSTSLSGGSSIVSKTKFTKSSLNWINSFDRNFGKISLKKKRFENWFILFFLSCSKNGEQKLSSNQWNKPFKASMWTIVIMKIWLYYSFGTW